MQRAAALLALCLCAPFAQAKTAEALGVRIDLPFEYTLLRKEEGRSMGRTLSVSQRHELEVSDATGKKQKVMLVAVYIAPERISNASMEAAADKDATEAAGKPGVRQSSTFKNDGFPFHFIDGPIENKSYPQRMSISGVVNGALYRFAVLAPDTSLLTSELAQRIKAIDLDYADLLKVKSGFEEEARLAVQDNQLDTPLSRLQLDKGTQARLSYSYLSTDGSGAPVARMRNFSLFKAGFWALQSLQLSIGCGREKGLGGEHDIRDFLLMTSEREEQDKSERYTQVSMPEATTMLGLPAETTTAKGPKVNALRSTGVHRWLVRHDGDFFQIGIERLNGSPVEKLLMTQLQSAAPMCQLGLQFGARSDP